MTLFISIIRLLAIYYPYQKHNRDNHHDELCNRLSPYHASKPKNPIQNKQKRHIKYHLSYKDLSPVQTLPP